jgi:hypothetical protein
MHDEKPPQYLLKDGKKTTDPRLDRIPQFDERSRQYPIRALRTTGRSLRSYTWRCTEWFDQGPSGKCVAYSLGHELAARPSELKGLTDVKLTRLYWNAQTIDPWEGGAYPGASPFYEGTSVLAGVKVLHKAGYFDAYRWAFNMDDVLYGLGHNGPAVLGIPWYSEMFNPDEDGYVSPYGFNAGGHAILARAINMKEKRVTLRNSWGKSWGVDGDCYVTFEVLEYLLQQTGECCFLVGRTVNPTTPLR